MGERLLVVPTKEIKPYFTGLSTSGVLPKYLSIISEKGMFMDREEAETNFDYKQLIMNILIKNNNNDYFMVRRTKNQKEKRLHDKYSLTIGGHVNDEDCNDLRYIATGLMNSFQRELTEEVYIDFNYKKLQPEFIGFINDDSNDVSRVHLGILIGIKVDKCSVKEKHIMVGEFSSVSYILNNYNKLESWSQIICDDYITNGGCNK